MIMSYCWCSNGLEPDYVDCSSCPFNQMNPEICQFRHAFHTDAVRWCDEKRSVQGLPLLSEDFDMMRENFSKKEWVEKQPQTSHSEPLEREALEHIQNEQEKPAMTLKAALIGIVVCVVLGFPMAYIGQLLQLFSMFVFDVLEILFTSGPRPEVWSETFKDSFFYAEFPNRYIYWTSLILAIWNWYGYDSKREAKGIELYLRVGSTALFAVVALLNIGLFISSVIGPLFILFGLFITAKRR